MNREHYAGGVYGAYEDSFNANDEEKQEDSTSTRGGMACKLNSLCSYRMWFYKELDSFVTHFLSHEKKRCKMNWLFIEDLLYLYKVAEGFYFIAVCLSVSVNLNSSRMDAQIWTPNGCLQH